MARLLTHFCWKSHRLRLPRDAQLLPFACASSPSTKKFTLQSPSEDFN